jgi:hypothetical protein
MMKKRNEKISKEEQRHERKAEDVRLTCYKDDTV